MQWITLCKAVMDMSSTCHRSLTEFRLPCRKTLSSQNVHSELLIQDPTTGKVHFLNPSAALIWNACDGQTDVEQCAARLRDAFDIPEEADLSADILVTLADFRQRGLVE